MKKFKFSVVMPIYNIESFLNEAINSVINQSLGFKDNIELILVNDGSTDNSETICKKYQEQYQNNIKYIKQRLNMLKKKWHILITIYPWHKEGKKESKEIIKYLKTLTNYTYEEFHNTENKEAPYVINIKQNTKKK